MRINDLQHQSSTPSPSSKVCAGNSSIVFERYGHHVYVLYIIGLRCSHDDNLKRRALSSKTQPTIKHRSHAHTDKRQTWYKRLRPYPSSADAMSMFVTTEFYKRDGQGFLGIERPLTVRLKRIPFYLCHPR